MALEQFILITNNNFDEMYAQEYDYHEPENKRVLDKGKAPRKKKKHVAEEGEKKKSLEDELLVITFLFFFFYCFIFLFLFSYSFLLLNDNNIYCSGH